MNLTTTPVDPNDALAGLLDKYAVEPPGPWRIVGNTGSLDGALTLTPGELRAEPDLPERTVPLLAWRQERRFVELKRLIDEKTVTPLLMCRFSCLTDGREMDLPAILYREFDLIEWLSGAGIAGIYVSMTANRAANAIVQLAGGAVGSVEAGTTLPEGAAMQDRHELIARRGIASDRVVDTQVAQSSVHAWTDGGHRQYTDVDAELFGLDAGQAARVRSAFQILREPELAPVFRERHRHLRRLVALACESDRRRERLTVNTEGGLA